MDEVPEVAVVPVPDEPLPHPSVYPHFDLLVKAIEATDRYAWAAGGPDESWVDGPGVLIARQVLADAIDHDGLGDADPPVWLLIDHDHPWWVLCHSPADATAALARYPDYFEPHGPTELVEITSGRVCRPQPVLTMTWVESICMPTGAPDADLADHSAHPHQEVTYR